MPKAMTDKDRILHFAFKATIEQLEDAIAVLKAALNAKKAPTRNRKPATKPVAVPKTAASGE